MISGISTVILLIAIAINIVPADVDTITLSVPDKKDAMSFGLLEDGGWVETNEGRDLGILYVDGMKMTIKHSGGEKTFDLLKELGLEEGTKLKDVKEIEVSWGTVTIKKVEDGIDYHIETREGTENIVKIRWSKKAE